MHVCNWDRSLNFLGVFFWGGGGGGGKGALENYSLNSKSTFEPLI